jgi:hypothetical protein
MSRRQKEWARLARLRLIVTLGGRCAACGATQHLTFDCRVPRGHAHHGQSTDTRMCFYRAQARVGNLQLLCDRCNSLKADGTMDELREQLTALGVAITLSNTIRVGEQCEQQRDACTHRGNGAIEPVNSFVNKRGCL